MPSFRITGPNGETYRVNAPDGATEEQALAYVKAQHAHTSAAPAKAAPAPAAKRDIFSPIEDAGDAVFGAGKKLIDDTVGAYRETKARALAPLPSLPDAGRRAIGDLVGSLKIPGDAMAAVASPLTAAADALAIRPAARALARFGPQAYSKPTLTSGAQPLDEAGTEEALRGAMQTALMGAKATPGLKITPVTITKGGPKVAATERRAMDYVTKVAGQKPLGEIAEAADPMMGAEAAGQAGKRALGALARREGTTGEELQTAIAARSAAKPQRFLDTLSEASGVDPRTIADVPAMSARTIAEAAQVPDVLSGSGGQGVHARLNREFDAAKRSVDDLYDTARAAKPEGAQLTAQAKPVVTTNLREAMRDFDPDSIPRVAKALDKLDGMKSVTARDLFETRTRVGKLRASADPVEGEAAGTLVKALDEQMDVAAQSGDFTGDTSVIDQWKQAIAARADLGKQFQGKDLIQNLTERTYRGGARTNAVAGEDASDAIFGRNGVSPRQNASRDLSRLRDRLGADSPEWASLQDEAFTRVMGKDAGSDKFGQAWDKFSRQSPQVADLLLSPANQERLATSRATIADATKAREAFEGGAADLFNRNVNARQFSDGFEALSTADRTSLRAGVANRLNNMANSGTFNVKALTAPHVQDKLKVLFGEDGAKAIANRASQEAQMSGFDQRYGATGNSVTSEMQAAMGEQDAVGAAGQFADDYTQNLTKGPVKALGPAIGGQLQKLLAGLKTAGMSEEARNQAGRTLMLSPKDMVKAIEAYRAQVAASRGGVRVDPRALVPLLQAGEAQR